MARLKVMKMVDSSPSKYHTLVSIAEGALWNTDGTQWQKIIEETLEEAFKTMALAPEVEVEISIYLTMDQEVQQLNKKFRGYDKPTNVLSFPSNISQQPFHPEESGVYILGDIVLAYETIAQEAHDQRKELQAHFRHLLIHGLLHLFGYNHEEVEEAKTMESLEVKILSRLKVANPYV